MQSASLKDFFIQQKLNEADQEEEIDNNIGIYFRYGTKNYCTSISNVKEIIDFPIYVPAPVDIGSTLGVFNLRGNIIPIMDPENFFNSIQTNLKSKAQASFQSMRLRLVIFELADGLVVSLPVFAVGKTEIVAKENQDEGFVSINGIPHEKFNLEKFIQR